MNETNKFKIGDIVRIKKLQEIDFLKDYNKRIGYVDEMKHWGDRLAIVFSSPGDKAYKLLVDRYTYNYDENWLELVASDKEKYIEPSSNETFDTGESCRLATIEELKNNIKYKYAEDEAFIYYNGAFEKQIYNKIKDKKLKIKRYIKADEYVEVKADKTNYYMLPITMIRKWEKSKKVEEKEMNVNEELIEEMISKVDVKRFKKVLASAFQIKGTELLGIDKMLREWAINKAKLYELLGNELMITETIEYNAGEKEWEEIRYNLAKKFPGIGYLLMNSPIRCFVQNKYENFSGIIERLIGNKHNMKYTTFLSEVFHNDEFDIELSKYMSQTKVKGNIVISIDPNDFLTMSFNQSGWRSCHTISHDGCSKDFGEFVAGIFSYIQDAHTMISFRHNGTKVDFPIGKAKVQDYSKNWRELLYTDTEAKAFCASRQYPEYNEEISKAVRTLLENQMSKIYNVNNTWKSLTTRDSDVWENYLTDTYNPLHYNDMLHGYEGKLVYNKELDNKSVIDMQIGATPICPICGEQDIEETSHPVCENCWDEFDLWDD